MSKEKYNDLANHPGIRVRVERLDGNWSHGKSNEVWWDRELIAFMTAASPSVRTIVKAETQLLAAIRAEGLGDALAETPSDQRYAADSKMVAEVIMFHGTFVKIEVWCPKGTAARLGIKGYAK